MEQNLLNKAKQDYPIGTKYISIHRKDRIEHSRRICEVRGEFMIFDCWYWGGLVKSHFITDGYGGVVYSRGEWMEKV